MDLALNQIPMQGFICPLETVLYQEETGESIVPDAYPDILSILATEARVQLAKKECGEGKVELTGNVAVTVIYQPEGESGPCRLEVNLPYRLSAAAQGITADCALVAVPRLRSAETRLLNPRKVLCRVELAVLCQGWSQCEDTLCEPCEDREGGLQQRCEDAENYIAAAIAEKAFAYTDQVNLGAGNPTAEELLGHRLELKCAEAKVIGNKLIFKGEAELTVRYRTAENALGVGRWELPFSQIMEVSDIEEEGSCTMDLLERDSRVELADDGDGRTLNVHLELAAQAVVRQNRAIRLFTDAYSVTQAVSVQTQSYRLTRRWEENAVTQTERLTLETPVVGRSVEDCFITLGQPQVDTQRGIMGVQGWITALYLDEEGVLRSQSGAITVESQAAIPQDGKCLVRCETVGQPQAVAAASGIEVRAAVRFHYLITQEKEVSGVVALQAEEEPTERKMMPSVVLRIAQKGESLWDIAKAYSTTEGDILAVNEIADTQRLEGQLLLIPKSR